MNVEKYNKLVKRHIKKDNYLHNYLVSFLCGGLLGMFAQIIYIILINVYNVSSFLSKSLITLSIIFIASFLTSIGVFDKIITKFRCGLIIPTTGFAHSITSSAIDVKKEGYIKGLGSNFFHLAGSVILYSIVVSFILVIVKVVFFA